MNNFFYEFNNKKAIKVEFQEGVNPVEGEELASFFSDDKKLSIDEFYLIVDQSLSILAEMRSVFPPIVLIRTLLHEISSI